MSTAQLLTLEVALEFNLGAAAEYVPRREEIHFGDQTVIRHNALVRRLALAKYERYLISGKEPPEHEKHLVEEGKRQYDLGLRLN